MCIYWCVFPVSYTHLDVYKRQGQYLTIDDSKYAGTPGGKTQNIYALNYNDKDNDIKISLGSVSYTHLDVYKRQKVQRSRKFSSVLNKGM